MSASLRGGVRGPSRCARSVGLPGVECNRSGMISVGAAASSRGTAARTSLVGWLAASQGVDERMKTVFTTGEAAKICKVSQQTIIRCFDNGQLKGFRVPGSRFRRIPREALYKFMKDNGIPTDALESGKRKVLLVDDDA